MVQTISAAHQVDLGPAGAAAVAVARDGSVVYVAQAVDAFSPWAWAVYRWPEVLGALVGLGVLLAVVVTWRVRRRPRRAGVMYCRRCGYELIGTPEGRPCPECGRATTARARVRGRARLLRVAPAWSVALALLVGYGLLWAGGVGRENRAILWFDWSSVRLHEWIVAAGLEPPGYASGPMVTRVLAIDPRDGSRRRLAEVQGSIYEMLALPDGGVVLRLSTNPGRLVAIGADGRERGRWNVPPGAVASVIDFAQPRRPSGWDKLVAVGSAGPTVYGSWLDTESQATRLYAWDIASGTMTERLSTSVQMIEVRTVGLQPASALFYVWPDAEPVRVLEFPFPGRLSMNAAQFAARDFRRTGRRTVRVHRLGSGESAEEFELPGQSLPGELIPDPARLRFFAAVGPRSLMVVDLAGRSRGAWATPPEGSTAGLGGRTCTVARGRFMLVPEGAGGMHVRDLETEGWAGRLATAVGGWVVLGSAGTAEGSLAAVLSAKPGPTGPRGAMGLSYLLELFDLGSLGAGGR